MNIQLIRNILNILFMVGSRRLHCPFSSPQARTILSCTSMYVWFQSSSKWQSMYCVSCKKTKLKEEGEEHYD